MKVVAYQSKDGALWATEKDCLIADIRHTAGGIFTPQSVVEKAKEIETLLSAYLYLGEEEGSKEPLPRAKVVSKAKYRGTEDE